MKKIHLLILITTGILCFGLSFGIGWHLKKKRLAIPPQPPAASSTESSSAIDVTSGPSYLQAASIDEYTPGLSERQLQNLIEDIRERMREYRSKQKQLAQEEQRIQLSHQTLQEEIDRLNQLRVKLAALAQNLEQKQQQLQQSILQIESIEQANFQRLAATYDKMDTTQAARILGAMAAGPQSADAIKILYYMSERTAAKVLGEIGAAQPETASMISLKLKRIQEIH
jgi:flagellar motility protein MotE (MotC chaperone)